MKEFCIIIPAVKKNVAFPDDLVKKLCGVPLIQWTIDKAKNIASSEDIFLVTDSQEINLISERNKLNCVYKQDLRFQTSDIVKDLKFFIVKIYKCYNNIIILWPYTPLLNEKIIFDAYQEFIQNDYDVLTALKEEKHRVYRGYDGNMRELFFDEPGERFLIDLRSFLIFKSSLIADNSLQGRRIHSYLLDESEIEIKGYQDWWICEKLLKKRRIIFRVIGYNEVGMGHIYRALSLAHEITDHEIIFVCDDESHIAVNKIAGYDYRVETAEQNAIEELILSLKPDMVINDMLDTPKAYILKLKEKNIKVVNFEDLGSGSIYTDLTINELYDEPQTDGVGNIKWGNKYFFVRDEFNNARPHIFKKKVDNLLITFGGTDMNNLTFKVLSEVMLFCREEGIKINVVTGDGYLYKEELTSYLKEVNFENVRFTHATGVISKIMERAQIAIASNGRTLYELVHMNIPSIIISHHEREETHLFSKEANGMVNFGIYTQNKSEGLILESLKRLVHDNEYRRRLFDNTRKFNFSKNKNRVVNMILKLLN